MGLDSVELLVTVEDCFGIEILNEEAEQIVTVQDMVDCVAAHLTITTEMSPLKDAVFQELNRYMHQQGFSNATLTLEGLISETIPNEQISNWNVIFQQFGTAINFPAAAKNTWWNKIFPPVKFDYNSVTYSELVDVLCAVNHQQLIDKNAIHTKYEIYVVSMAIIEDKLGIHFFEIKPHQSFTNDLGMD